jgi:hypothetical protein
MPKPIEARSAVRMAKQNAVSPLAGKPAPKELLVDVARLEREYSSSPPYTQVLKLPFQFFKRALFRQADRLINATAV